MGHDLPVVVSSYALDDSGARQLWNWLLRRHGLSEDTKFGSVVEIARATLRLHAARLPSPFATVVARSVSPAVASTLFEDACRLDDRPMHAKDITYSSAGAGGRGARGNTAFSQTRRASCDY